MPARRPREIASFLCGALGVLLIFSSVLLGYARRSLFDERAFSARVASSLEDPRVARFVGEKITDAILEANPDLVGLRPVLIGLTSSVVISDPFRAAARRGARALHRAVTTGAATDALLTVRDVGAVVQSAMATSPELAEKIPTRVTAVVSQLEHVPGGERLLRLVQVAPRARVAIFGILFLGIGLAAVSAWLARDRRRAIVRLGVALTALSLVLAVAAAFGGGILALFVRREEFAPFMAGLAGAFLRGLMTWALTLGFAGLVLAAGSASLLERVPLTDWARRTAGWTVGPQPRMRIRLLRGVLGVLLGAALVFWPQISVTILAWLAGVLLAFIGLREGFVAALHLLPAMQPRAQAAQPQSRRAPFGMAIAVVSVFVVFLVGGAIWLLLRSPDDAARASVVTSFNGSPSLGDRRLDEVVFPTTHNSMSGANVEGWMFPNQSAGIAEQLADGVRGFLIDVHYGVPVGDAVKTEIEDEPNALAKYEAAVGKEGVEAALRIRDRLSGEESGERGIYMCHGFCELGAVQLLPELERVREFLVANPGEVLLFVIQDEGVIPEDIEACFQESELIDFVYLAPPGPPWPTLREMVATDQRVLVMTENQTSPAVPWIHLVTELMQETPYTFHKPEEFSNEPNRGGTAGSLYLLNHWIETTPMPLPSNAQIVNARKVLLGRVESFERRRGHLPNLLAVDFYREGDLIAVARELNERPQPKKRRR